MSNLDHTDIEILRALIEDEQASISEIAKKVSRSGPTVWVRVQNLADHGLVTLPPKKRARSLRITSTGKEFVERYDNVSYDSSGFAA